MDEDLFGMMGEDCPNPSPEQIENLETLVREHPGYTQIELWNLLPCPQGMSYLTFGRMICAFVRTKKVAVDDEGHFCWIYNPDRTHQFLSQPALLIK